MRSDFIQEILNSKKSSIVFDTMMFYNELQQKKHSRDILQIMMDRMYFIDNELKEDDEVCPESVMAYFEICMADMVYKGISDIKANYDYYSVPRLNKELNKEKKKYNSYNNFSLELKNKYLTKCVWNQEDEILALIQSTKNALGFCMHHLAMMNQDGQTPTVLDIYEMIDALKKELEPNSLPNIKNDSYSSTSLDLISQAMFADDYIKFVVDFALDSD